MNIPKSYIKQIISTTDYQENLLTKINDNIYLSPKEISLLSLYNIPFATSTSLNEIIYYIEEILESEQITDENLEHLAITLQERNYYQNTNK